MLPKISSLRAEQIELLLSFLSVPTSIRGASGSSRTLHNLYHGSDFVQTARTARFLKITRDVAKSTKRFQAISDSSVHRYAPPLPQKKEEDKEHTGFQQEETASWNARGLSEGHHRAQIQSTASIFQISIQNCGKSSKSMRLISSSTF